MRCRSLCELDADVCTSAAAASVKARARKSCSRSRDSGILLVQQRNSIEAADSPFVQELPHCPGSSHLEHRRLQALPLLPVRKEVPRDRHQGALHGLQEEVGEVRGDPPGRHAAPSAAASARDEARPRRTSRAPCGPVRRGRIQRGHGCALGIDLPDEVPSVHRLLPAKAVHGGKKDP